MKVRLNLSPVPFRNYRPRYLLFLVLLIGALGTGFLVGSDLYSYFSKVRGEKRKIAQLNLDIAHLERKLRYYELTLGKSDLPSLIKKVKWANSLIKRRVLLWSNLFSELERTLPPDVLVISIVPQGEEQGGIRMEFHLLATSYQSVLGFISYLEKSPFFTAIYPVREMLAPGRIEFLLDAVYLPRQRGKSR